MQRRIYEWIQKNKYNDTILINFLKFLYSIGRVELVCTVITIVFSIIIPILYEKGKTVLSFIFLILLVLCVIFDWTCKKYQSMLYNERKFASEVLLDNSSLTKSIIIEIQNKQNWKTGIFKTTSDLVCGKIHDTFKDLLYQ